MTDRHSFTWSEGPSGFRREPEDRLLVQRMQDLVRRIENGKRCVEAPPATVDALEMQLGIPLPSDYRAFLRLAGGEHSPSWRGLWRVHEVASLNQHLPVFQWFQGLIGFGNEGFVVYAFDYRRGPRPTVATVGLSCSEPEDVNTEADTFEEWLERTLEG